MRVITAEDLSRQRTLHPEQFHCIDVRSPAEYAAGHIPGAINIPLEQIEARLPDIDPNLPVILTCKSGIRARIAAGLLAPCREQLAVLEGGTAAWASAGLPLVVNTKTRWSLERQVRLVAGLIVLAGVILALTVSPYWVYLSGFVGLGLTVAGLTDFCAMGLLLARMPWNKARHCRVGSVQATAHGQSGPMAVH